MPGVPLPGPFFVSLPGKQDTVRGLSGVSLLIIDEASRVSGDLYFSIRPMLAVSGGRLLALSTPFGPRGWWIAISVEGLRCQRFSTVGMAPVLERPGAKPESAAKTIVEKRAPR